MALNCRRFTAAVVSSSIILLSLAAISWAQAAPADDREVIFFDDFAKSADGRPSERWTAFSGQWSVANGVLRQTQIGYDLGIVAGDLYLSCDYRLETKVRLVDGGEGAGLYWNLPDAPTGENGNMARSEGEGPLMYGWMEGRYYNCDGWGKGTKLKDKQWHTMRLDVRNSNGTFDLLWDGQKIVDNAKMTRREGFVGLESSIGQFEFDDFTVSVAKGTDWNRQPKGRVAPEWCLSNARLPGGGTVYPVWNKHMVRIISPQGLLVREFGEQGAARNQLNLPTAAAVGPTGQIYIAEAGNNRVQVFDQQGHSLRVLCPQGKDALNAPSGVAIDGKGRVWVVDGGNCRLVCMDESGKVLRTIGSAGEGAAQFRRPGQATLVDGRLYVADTGNGRIQVFNVDNPSAAPEAVKTDPVGEPCSVARVGDLYVVTTWRGLSMYTKDWKHLRDCGGRASQAPWPHMTVLDAQGNIVPPKIDPEDAKAAAFKHFVPVNKHLDPEWVKTLRQKGTGELFWGNDLEYIAMPVGGICAGQLYLRGDGTLGCWRLFCRTGPTEIGQGFAVLAKTSKGLSARRLNQKDFPAVTFRGQYPVGTMTYKDDGYPLEVRMEAFSPFVPLDSADSTLPATIFRITVKNTSDKTVSAGVVGWLDNGVLNHSRKRIVGSKNTRVERLAQGTVLLHTAGEWSPPSAKPRADVMLADFEGDDYRGWTATGTAFGTKPAAVRDATRGSFHGKGLVDTFIPSADAPTGTLVSPEFVIERPFLNFLIGGGAAENEECVNLLVDGKAVRTMAGEGTEQLKERSFDVTALAGKKARIQIVDNGSGGWGHIMVDDIRLSDTPAKVDLKGMVDQGSMAFALAGPAESVKKLGPMLGSAGLGDLTAAKDEQYSLADPHNAALAPPMEKFKRGQERTYVFALTWWFPAHNVGKAYVERFADAKSVATYVLEHKDALVTGTLKWRDTYYDSTLPVWLLDRLHAPVSTLATDTCELWKGGRFWAWEGAVSGEGTCTHVWNYEHALARLFPDLERSVREKQDFGTAFYEDGLVGFRDTWKSYAGDGQCGTVLKAYREHQMSADGEFLKRNWPKIKKALEYSIQKDGNDDGLIEVAHQTTYDVDFYGPNTFVGALYLGALRAGEEMARDMGDEGFAARCRKIFDSGSRLGSERLWNGEYFVQLVDLKAHPGNQYADGCLADQMFGQGWAHHVGLGYLYPPDKVRGALGSIWKYNWAPDTGPQNAMHGPERWFVRSSGESGLFICTWPKSMHMEGASVRYRDEVWSGIEYQVAGNMVWEGMLDEALVMVRGVHELYHPSHRRNPYDEVEFGDHYSRAMASWGMFTALSGYEYHGPKGHIGFAPRISPEDFRSAFTAAEGWGSFSQKRESQAQIDRIELRWGKLRIKSLALGVTAGANVTKVTVAVGGKEVACTHAAKEGRLDIVLGQEITLVEGQNLVVTVK